MAFDKLVDSVKLDATLADIADAIKLKTIWNNSTKDDFEAGKYQGDFKIPFENLANEIRFIDRLRPMTMYPDGLDNGYIGSMVVKIAASYYLARKLSEDLGQVQGAEDFDYSSDENPFNTVQNPDSANYMKACARDKLGRALLDCSSYVGFVLRGIPYEKSPFPKAEHQPVEGEYVRWKPCDELPAMYGNTGWEYTILDKQPEGEYRNFGFDGYSTVRTAGELAEFFMKYGYVVYDQKRDGERPADLVDRLQPGDLLFFSHDGEEADEYNKTSNRFRAIHHIGIVAEREERYYHVTGNNNNNKTEDDEVCVAYNYVADSNGLSLVCRPNYLHRGLTTDIPIGVNMLSFPWTYGTGAVASGNEYTLKTVDMNTITVNCNMTTADRVELAGTNDQKYSCIKLQKGTYKLSGLNGSGYKSSSFALQVRKMGGEDFETAVRSYDGKDAEFTIEEDTLVQVRLYMGVNVKLTDFTFTPRLERIA